MKVRFRIDVLNTPAAYRALDRIVDHFSKGRHVWDLDDDQIIRGSGWLREDGGGYTTRGNLEVLDKALVRASAYEPTNSIMHELVIWVTLSPPPAAECELSPDDANRCLSNPVRVVVENAESDGAFLEAMVHAYKRMALLEAHTDQWWQVDHLGGSGEVGKRLDHILVQTVGPKRVLVVTDSDSRVPGEVTQTANKVRQACEQRNVASVILKKRASENYLPVGALHRLPRSYRPRVKSFERLSRQQCDHYDMKKGFSKVDGQASVPKEQVTLFAGVPPSRLGRLCGGFGEGVHKLFKTARRQITADAMIPVCGPPPNEITGILDAIERFL